MHGQPVAGMGAEDAGDGTPDGCGLTFDGTEYACACDGEPATVCHVEGDFNGPDGRASLFGPTACKAPNAVISCTETTTPCAFCDPQKSVW